MQRSWTESIKVALVVSIVVGLPLTLLVLPFAGDDPNASPFSIFLSIFMLFVLPFVTVLFFVNPLKFKTKIITLFALATLIVLSDFAYLALK